MQCEESSRKKQRERAQSNNRVYKQFNTHCALRKLHSNGKWEDTKKRKKSQPTHARVIRHRAQTCSLENPNAFLCPRLRISTSFPILIHLHSLSSSFVSARLSTQWKKKEMLNAHHTTISTAQHYSWVKRRRNREDHKPNIGHNAPAPMRSVPSLVTDPLYV